MMILVINSGSSSLKYQLFNGRSLTPVASGLVEKIGEPIGRVRHDILTTAKGGRVTREKIHIPTHEAALSLMIDLLQTGETAVLDSLDAITAVGHRVVHGGEQFSQPTVINQAVQEAIAQLIPLAPLHNPANLTGIQVAQKLFPQAVQVAVFDTAFHQTIPPKAYRYAVPRFLYEEHAVRVYGFHGTSHRYVTQQAIAHLGQAAADTNLITAHLGNGCSITAVRGGHSVDTSMGFSPLSGLIMGTRSGDVDPALPLFLATALEMEPADIDRLLNKQSGLVGLTGQNDLREIEARYANGDVEATLALEMVAYRIQKYVGMYTAVLGRVDGLAFTAGIGENSPLMRKLVCAELAPLGFILDADKNAQGGKTAVVEIQAANSPAKILIIPTNEEREIATQTRDVVEGLG